MAVHPKLKNEDVTWVVNDIAELGVKIGDQCFFMYKGRSYQGGTKYRHVYKREFGETCHPDSMKVMPINYIGCCGEDESVWKNIENSLEY